MASVDDFYAELQLGNSLNTIQFVQERRRRFTVKQTHLRIITIYEMYLSRKLIRTRCFSLLLFCGFGGVHRENINSRRKTRSLPPFFVTFKNFDCKNKNTKIHLNLSFRFFKSTFLQVLDSFKFYRFAFTNGNTVIIKKNLKKNDGIKL